MQCPQLCLHSQDSTQAFRSHSSGPGVLQRCPAYSGWPTFSCNATPTMSSHHSPTAPSPLLHHSQPGGPRSGLACFPHFWILRCAQAVKPGTSVCCPVRPLMAHLQGGHCHSSSRSSDPHPTDLDPSVSRACASPGSAWPISTSSTLLALGALHHGLGPLPIPSPCRPPP